MEDYESSQIRFGEQDKSWNMRDGVSGQQFEHAEKSMRSDPSEEKLRSLDRAIQKSDRRLEKLYRKKGVVKVNDRRGKIHSRTAMRLADRERPGAAKARLRDAGQKDYKRELSRRRRLENRVHAGRRLLFRAASRALDDDSLKADATDAFPGAMRAARSSGRLLYRGSRKMLHKFLEKNSVYRRYDAEQARNARLKKERERLGSPEDKRKKPSPSEEYKRRRKKQQVTDHHRQSQRSFSKRASEARHKAKKIRERAGQVKRILKGLFSAAGAIFLLAGAAFILLSAVLAMVSGGSSIGAAFLSMNDYGTMTECTDLFQDKCTGLYMYLNIDRDSNLEPDLRAMLGSDIYEFIYAVDVPITYDQIDLIAYLSAKYGTFTVDMVQAELEEIFAEMFVVEAVVKTEQREIMDPYTGAMVPVDKKICYVTLKATGFNDVVAGRLTDGEKNSYLGYRLSSCGQQAMNPVMEEDWTDLVSSPYGSRFHPIYKEYRKHEGVDIAVPEGTKVYAAVSGKVTAARYSDSAGYMVSITDDNGFTVTYMHLSSYSVAVGQKVSAGQLLALSGNSGASTGPHLHLAVQDAEGNYLNPIFMIPQTCAK